MGSWAAVGCGDSSRPVRAKWGGIGGVALGAAPEADSGWGGWCGCRESAKRWGAYEASRGERGVIGEGEGEGGDEVGTHALGTGLGGIRTARYRAAAHG